MKEKVGVLHPGDMGISVAASAKRAGCQVYWASEGRSQETRKRAEKHTLEDAHTLAELCGRCSVLVSVCPPHAAEAVAEGVLAHGFKGLYVDANAISPQRVVRIGEAMAERGVAFVDGGIIGGPAWKPGTTWLYLSGKEAERVADCFSAGPLGTVVIGERTGKASALKMCYAAYTKGTTALLAAILGAAERWRVRQELENQWSRDGSDFAEQTKQRVRGSTTKAWRFVGEMEEIAATFKEAGMPSGFHTGAADIYRRMAHFKGLTSPPSVEGVLADLLRAEGEEKQKPR